MSKREQNKQIVRAKLLEQSLQLFSENGVEQTTVADIVAACDIGRGTFYNYFDDVRGVIDALIEDMYTEVRREIKAARENKTNLYQMLYSSFKCYLDYVSRDDLAQFHRLNQAYLRSASYSSKAIRSLILDLQHDLKELKEFGDYKENYELQLLSVVLVGTPVELFLNIHQINTKISGDELADFLAKLFTKAIKPKKVTTV